MGKLINFVLVYLLSFVNFIVMLIPIGLMLAPLAYLMGGYGLYLGTKMLLLLAFLVSAYMTFYLVVDTLFGFTVRYYTKAALPIAKAGFIEGQQDIMSQFEFIKKRFNCRNVGLYISQSAVPNAYAIGSFRKKAVIITTGLLQQFYDTSSSREEFVSGIRAVMAHEMSHLVNRDFIPGVLMYSNEVIRGFITRIIYFIFRVIVTVIRILPKSGGIISFILHKFYQLIDWMTGTFYRFLFKPLYEFLSRFLSRGMEYRCDKDAAKLFGGESVALALSKLGNGAYFSIFSTHPATKARMRHVKHVMPQGGVVGVHLLNQLVNMVAVLFLIAITCYLSTQADIASVYPSVIKITMTVMTFLTEQINMLLRMIHS